MPVELLCLNQANNEVDPFGPKMDDSKLFGPNTNEQQLNNLPLAS